MDLVLRIPETVRARGRVWSVVNEHNAIFAEKGSVALAKFGHPLSDKTLTEMTNAVAEGSASLHLVVKQNGQFRGFTATIKDIGQMTRGRDNVRSLFPEYYRSLDDEPASFVVLASPLVRSDLTRLKLASNSRPLLDVVGGCRTAVMLVEELDAPRTATTRSSAEC